LQLIRRYRIPALFCTLAVLLCELISRPYADMGICDDGPYILMARTLATTGHIAYNGWAAPMLGWQLYLGAAFIKLFGFSFTAVRMGTIFIAMLLAFVLQRTLVRAGITERNATLATLALVLSPLYLMLSATFMTDIYGLFAIVLCLYGCLRALQSSSSRAAIAWLCFAVVTNALCGTSRQIAWLGILVLVPSTLWLLRARRQVLLAGAAANLAGFLFIFACMHWLKLQPYSIPEHLLPDAFPLAETLRQLYHTFLDVPFLLLPIIALFLPEIRRSRPRLLALISALSLGYILLALHYRHLSPNFMLMPTHGDWVDIHGIFDGMQLQGTPPQFLDTVVQILLTIASIGGFFGLIASFFNSSHTTPAPDSSASISWKQLSILLVPFSIAYILLLIPRAAATRLFDRYLLALLVIALLCLTRYYQDRIHPRLPFAGDVLVAIIAIFAITVTHNTFALYRARVALADELHAAGVPDTSVDNGWEYNLVTELQHANHINFPGIVIPPDAYTPTPPLPAGTCSMQWYDYTPHIHPLYGASFDPTACDGPAPFTPVHYSRWLAAAPGTLYIVNYLAPTKP
jgi:Dolichyl-phosphate-mannose-protein mannosyltransferase